MNGKMLEELTLYLDGEHPDAAGFEKELRRNPELAARLREYQALSHMLRALPAPDTHPAFATRVIAHLDEKAAFDPAAIARAWRKAMIAPALVMLLGIALWLYQPAPETTTPETVESTPALVEVPPAQRVAEAARWADDEAIIEELAALLAQGVDAETLIPYDGAGWYRPSEDELSSIFESGVSAWELDSGFYGVSEAYPEASEIMGDDYQEFAPFLLEQANE